MSASLGKPSYGLRLDDPFTGVAHGAPSCQVFSVSFIIPLPAHGQLLRTIRPLVSAGEVADESVREIQPAINAFLWQIIQPDSGRTFQHLRYIPHRPPAISARDVHRGDIVCQPVFRLSTVVICFCAPGQLKVWHRWLPHDPGPKTSRTWRTLLLKNFRQIDSVELVAGIMCRQLAVPQPGSERDLGHQAFIPQVTGSLHGRITIIMAVWPWIAALTLKSLPDTLLLPRLVRCRIPRWLALASRIATMPGLIILAGALVALTGISISPTGIALVGDLFFGIGRFICLQLLAFAGVDTPVTSPADMR